MTLYKVLNTDGSPYHGGVEKWPLPRDGRPGEWMPAIEGELRFCENGYHLCREQDLLHWLGPAIFVAEYRGELMEDDNKVIVRQARLLRKTAWDTRAARLFACDCAERALPSFEQEYPTDKRPRQAIAVARRFADSAATVEELAAAGAAAWVAAWDAVSRWQTLRLLEYLEGPA